MNTLKSIAEEIAHDMGMPYNHTMIEKLKQKIVSARAMILKRSANKRSIPDFFYQGICDELECKPIIECCHVSERASKHLPKALRTKQEIPKPLRISYNPFNQVSPIDITGTYATAFANFQYVEPQRIEFLASGKFFNAVTYYTYINDRVIILNYPNNSLKFIYIKGLFEDPSKLKAINDCKSGKPCFDDDEEEFPIPSDLIYDMKSVIYKELNIQRPFDDEEITIDANNKNNPQ